MSKLKKDQKEYIAAIHHNSYLLNYLYLGTLSKNELKVVFGILEIIHNIYSQESVTISYSDIAAISEYATELYENNTQFLGPEGKKHMVYNDYPIFLQFEVNHSSQELTLYISETVYLYEIKKNNGNIIEEEKRIADLFRKEDWSEIQIYEKVKEGYLTKIEKRK